MMTFEGVVSRGLKPVNTRLPENGQPRENGYSQDTAIFERIEGEKTKLSLYQTDPLVDVKGLKRYAIAGLGFASSVLVGEKERF